MRQMPSDQPWQHGPALRSSQCDPLRWCYLGMFSYQVSTNSGWWGASLLLQLRFVRSNLVLLQHSHTRVDMKGQCIWVRNAHAMIAELLPNRTRRKGRLFTLFSVEATHIAVTRAKCCHTMAHNVRPLCHDISRSEMPQLK